MPDIPNTSTPGQALLSVGNGTNALTWGTVSGGGSLPTGAYNGQIIWWNGTTWVLSASYAPPSSNSYLRWNGTIWEPDTGVLTGDITGSFATTNVSAIQGVTVAASSPTNGQVLSYSSGLGEWIPASPASGAAGNSWSANSSGLSPFTPSSASPGSEVLFTPTSTFSVSGYTKYTVILTGTLSNSPSGAASLNCEINTHPYSTGVVTGGSEISISRPATGAASGAGISATFTVTLPSTGSYQLAPYMRITASMATPPQYQDFTFTVIGVQ